MIAILTEKKNIVYLLMKNIVSDLTRLSHKNLCFMPVPHGYL